MSPRLAQVENCLQGRHLRRIRVRSDVLGVSPFRHSAYNIISVLGRETHRNVLHARIVSCLAKFLPKIRVVWLFARLERHGLPGRDCLCHWKASEIVGVLRQLYTTSWGVDTNVDPRGGTREQVKLCKYWWSKGIDQQLYYSAKPGMLETSR